ncbi:MAG: hypothetical protein GX815_12435 [Clostridiales bacterium]|nr:hypothetical protein [Clostridiales bacterium]
MEFAIVPPKLKFHNALDTVRKSHPYVEEIAWMDRNDDVIKLLHQIDSLKGLALKEYAISLPNSKLELIFHALMKEVTLEQKEKLFTIMNLRMKKRFYKYNWIMLLEHYTNVNLQESFALIAEHMKEKVPSKYNLSLASKVSFEDDNIVEHAIDVLKSEESTLNDFFTRYGIKKESNFGKALIQDFFLHCDSDGFQKNSQLFLAEIQNPKNSHSPQISHYLEVMNVLEYVEDINNYLLNLYNSQDDSCGIWAAISEKLKVKLIEWSKLKDLGKYMGIHSEKYYFWRNYYTAIEKTEWYPELHIMLLYLPGHVVIDAGKDKDASYLYKRAAFNIDNLANWSLDPELVVSMKDAILENKRSEIYELNYEGLGKLYIRDYLEMTL